MPEISIPFGDLLPDQPEPGNPGCLEAVNVVPIPDGYGPLPSMEREWYSVPTGEGATGNETMLTRGAASFRKTDGTAVMAFGDTTQLAWYDGVARYLTTGYTDIGNGGAWDFCQFNQYVVATAPNNAPQYLSDVDSATTWAALPGSPPNAKYCAKVSEFVMLGGIENNPTRIQWGSWNNPTGSWAVGTTAARQAQAGFADLPTRFGPVKRIIGGRFAVVFQERGVHRLDYVGPPIGFRATLISEGLGATVDHSVVTNGTLTAFLCQEGFAITNGNSVEAIGSQKIRKWYLDSIAVPTDAMFCAATDYERSCFIWGYKRIDADTFSSGILYNWELDRWSTTEWTIDWLADWQNSAGAFESTAEATPTFNRFTGDPMTNRIVTGEFELRPGRRVFVRSLRPVVEGTISGASARLEFTDDTFNAELNGPTKFMSRNGTIPVRGEGRRVRARVWLGTDDWTQAMGSVLEAEIGGAS